jgi:NAD(P)-dependent dehydrogenase (short-subunit alcohol dehydrogenase family)
MDEPDRSPHVLFKEDPTPLENHMTEAFARSPVCAIVGVGPGNGAAFVRRFANEGYRVAMIARSGEVMDALATELPQARAYRCDVAEPAQVEGAFAAIAGDMGPVDALIYNAGKGVWGTVDEISPQAFEEAWRINAFGAFVAAKCVIPAMRAKGEGQIIFIGATASRRGGARTAAFASAKAAQRSLAESLARAYGPFGIHVSIVIIDGVVDEPRARKQLADKPDDFFVKPEDIADTLIMLCRQHRSAWSFELEARPFGEAW